VNISAQVGFIFSASKETLYCAILGPFYECFSCGSIT